MTDTERVTTATIDRRVERLEVAQAETDRKIDMVDQKVAFMKDLLEIRFKGMEATLESQGNRLDAFIRKIDELVEEGLKSSADLEATPLGRQVAKRLTGLEKIALENRQAIVQMQGFGHGFRAYILPIVSVGVALISLFVAMSIRP